MKHNFELLIGTKKGYTMTDKEKGTITEDRIYWLDNLRTFMIFLVVLLHAALIYEKNSIGTLWWIVIDPSTGDLPGLLCAIGCTMWRRNYGKRQGTRLYPLS